MLALQQVLYCLSISLAQTPVFIKFFRNAGMLSCLPIVDGKFCRTMAQLSLVTCDRKYVTPGIFSNQHFTKKGSKLLFHYIKHILNEQNEQNANLLYGRFTSRCMHIGSDLSGSNLYTPEKTTILSVSPSRSQTSVTFIAAGSNPGQQHTKVMRPRVDSKSYFEGTDLEQDSSRQQSLFKLDRYQLQFQ